MSWDRLGASYDRAAGRYEEHFWDELEAKPWDRQRLSAFAAQVADPVVEFGCGPGQVGAYVRAAGRQVIGLDLSGEMVRRAAAHLDAAAVADLRHLPLAAESAGGLLAFYSVIHIRRTELEATFCEFRRVLKAGGRVLLSAHEGEGEIHQDEFLGIPVPFAATLFGLEELAGAVRAAGSRAGPRRAETALPGRTCHAPALRGGDAPVSYGRTSAASRAWSLSWVSASSSAGSEPATTPLPAKILARAPSTSAQRMPMAQAPSPRASTQPTGPA